MLTLDHVTRRLRRRPRRRATPSLELPDGRCSPSSARRGCGKSTLLRAVAGLEPTAAGPISWDGTDLAGVPTHKRGFALMFQDGQLFGHLTVARNVGYALRLRRTPGRRPRGSRELLALVGLEGYADRLPGHAVRRRAAAGRAGPVAGRASRGCCCSTSRSRRSTPGCASGWPPTCARSCAPPAPPP